MATHIDSLGITGMKHMDFVQLREIFNHVMQEDIRWDREDYWNDRNARLAKWLDEVNEHLIHVKIKG